jgi:hypothetical protein
VLWTMVKLYTICEKRKDFFNAGIIKKCYTITVEFNSLSINVIKELFIMGLENKVSRLLGEKVPEMLKIVKKEYKKNPDTYQQKENAFIAEIKAVLTHENYTREILEQVCANNVTYGKAFKKMTPEEHKEVFNEIDELCLMRLEVNAHLDKFEPHFFVFVYAKDDRGVYANGILTDMGDSNARDPEESTRWLATCIKSGGKAKLIEVESSDELETYLENHAGKFPKWLKDLSVIQEPEYYPV